MDEAVQKLHNWNTNEKLREKKISKISQMDSNGGEFDMLDLLAFNCNQLTSDLRETSSHEAQDKILTDYLKRIDQEFEPINDFRDG